MSVEWNLLVDIRERRQAIALQRLLAARRAAQAAAAVVADAAHRLEDEVASKARHWTTTVDDAQGGTCRIEHLRRASSWSGVLDHQIAQAATACGDAIADAARVDATLAVSRREHGEAARSVEKAQQLQQRESTRARRALDARQDGVAEDFAAQTWAARRAV
jgi:hypothetical protein